MFLAIMVWLFLSVCFWIATEDAPVFFKVWGSIVIAFWIGVIYIALHFILMYW